MIGWMGLMATASAARWDTDRAVDRWEAAALPEGVECAASLDVAADGSVSVRKLRQCKAYAAVAVPVLERWRFAPGDAATREEVLLGGGAHDVLVKTRIQWASPEDAAAAESCRMRYVADADGRLSETEADHCTEPVREAFETTVAREWRFAPGAEGRLLPRMFGDPPGPAVVHRETPKFPEGATAASARCVVDLIVAPSGSPAELDVRDCEAPFAEAARASVANWRWEAHPVDWATSVAVTFVLNR
ncbi:MAG: hypothetical protein R3F59_35245 [Myxococcota bacterium]